MAIATFYVHRRSRLQGMPIKATAARNTVVIIRRRQLGLGANATVSPERCTVSRGQARFDDVGGHRGVDRGADGRERGEPHDASDIRQTIHDARPLARAAARADEEDSRGRALPVANPGRIIGSGATEDVSIVRCRSRGNERNTNLGSAVQAIRGAQGGCLDAQAPAHTGRCHRLCFVV